MNVLLVGGQGSLMDRLIIKFRKEGHRVYILTGKKQREDTYEKVFERYDFDYDSENLKEIFASVEPDLTICLGAFDTNFCWEEEQVEAARFAYGMMNLLVAYSMKGKGSFLFLSSDEVFGESSEKNLCESDKTTATSFRGMAFVQTEQLCESYRKKLKKDIVVLRVDHLYAIPKKREDVNNICAKMCMEALETEFIVARSGEEFSMLYEADAVEFIFRVARSKKTKHAIYHLSSSQPVTEVEIADKIAGEMETEVNVVVTDGDVCRRVLSNERFDREFGANAFADQWDIIQKIVKSMVKNKDRFLDAPQKKEVLRKQMVEKSKWLGYAAAAFLLNIVCFIFVYWFQQTDVHRLYFENIDFYLLYVLMFAIFCGRQQAILSALFSVSGYCFALFRENGSVGSLTDYDVYLWIAQLFVFALLIGHLRDEIRMVKEESREERVYLNRQLDDMRDINSSNARAKDILEHQVINQKDSIGKIYSITSKLDQCMSDEVLFYAVETVGEIMDSSDVAIYQVYNKEYARMFSAGSAKARCLGNSIRYREMEEMYQVICGGGVYINRKLDEAYPMMAKAICENGEMEMIIMVWGLPWERMTLGQANLLTVVSALIQNAVLRANRYMEALKDHRYIEETKILEPEAFTSLVHAYENARERNLTECTLVEIIIPSSQYEELSDELAAKLRQTDYLGIMENGKMYVLLANTNQYDAQTVVMRFTQAGFESKVVEKVKGLA